MVLLNIKGTSKVKVILRNSHSYKGKGGKTPAEMVGKEFLVAQRDLYLVKCIYCILHVYYIFTFSFVDIKLICFVPLPAVTGVQGLRLIIMLIMICFSQDLLNKLLLPCLYMRLNYKFTNHKSRFQYHTKPNETYELMLFINSANEF